MIRLDNELLGELAAWTAAGLTAKVWWRDDDAASDTPELRRLFKLAGEIGVVPALAVIPERADESLVGLLSSAGCCVWQHGWGHHFHTSGEFGAGRALDRMVDDALMGQRRLDSLFGSSGWHRVFVPPNHMLSMPFKSLIPSLGYAGLSGGVPLTTPVPGVMEVNAEVDVMDWPAGTILSSGAIGKMLVEQLSSRRRGEVPAERPIGILTHHLAFDDRAWENVCGIMASLSASPALEWLRPQALFSARMAGLPSAGSARSGSPPPAVTVVITSCGRQDLLAQTLDSFLEWNTYPVAAVIVIEDGPPERNRALEERYRHQRFAWLSTGARVGQIAAIDMAYAAVATDYIFHCEDDWIFVAPGFIEASIAVLESNPAILQVWIRSLSDTNGHPVSDLLLVADDIPYRLLQPDYHSDEWGTWHGFSLNPGLRRRRDYELIGSFGALGGCHGLKAYEIERKAAAIYRDRGLLAAILAGNEGRGYVRHSGWGRRVLDD